MIAVHVLLVVEGEVVGGAVVAYRRMVWPFQNKTNEKTVNISASFPCEFPFTVRRCRCTRIDPIRIIDMRTVTLTA